MVLILKFSFKYGETEVHGSFCDNVYNGLNFNHVKWSLQGQCLNIDTLKTCCKVFLMLKPYMHLQNIQVTWTCLKQKTMTVL